MSKYARNLNKVVGYRKGEPFDLYVVRLHGILFAVNTAIAFLIMQWHAKTEHGVNLRPTEAWRHHDYQTELWEERQDPDVRASRGSAARPGYSRHQSGEAVDIRTGISFRTFKKIGVEGAIKRSREFAYLHRFGPKFGWARTVASEPWHWEYRASVDWWTEARIPG